MSSMTIRQISSRLEISFWQIFIGLLSESQPIRKSIRWLYLKFIPAVTDLFLQIDRKILLRWAVAGLGSGILAGFLISLF